MRSKEEAHDYRYFPEPDLPPLIVDAARVEAVRRTMPELPEARRQRFVAAYAIPDYDAGVLTQSSALADYFEAVAHDSKNPKAASNWVMGELLRITKEHGIDVSRVPLTPAALAGLIRLVDRGAISSSVAKDVFATMYESGRSAEAIVEAGGLAQTSDEGALLGIVKDVIAQNPDAIAQVRAGRNNAFGFLVGQAMKASKGKGNPKVINDLLRRELN
jgi:aspartyl-tRNA(Asn)/glutamyl-tRNA(Gln) amidotransferase subunit B